MSSKGIILLPVHNEEDSIDGVLTDIFRFVGLSLEAKHIEIVVVDSFCTDRSVEKIAKYPVTVLSAKQSGYWNALREGYQYALAQNCHWLVQLDGDGQHPPHAIWRIQQGLQQADWVIASRHNTGSTQELSRIIGQQICQKYVQYKTHTTYTDISSGFWAVSRTGIEIFANYPLQTADAALRFFAWKHGLSFLEIPVAMNVRENGASMHAGWRSIVHLWKVYQDIQRLSEC